MKTMRMAGDDPPNTGPLREFLTFFGFRATLALGYCFSKTLKWFDTFPFAYCPVSVKT
jgi:hypothetical protein